MLARHLQANPDLLSASQNARQTSHPCHGCEQSTLVEVPFAGDPSLLVDTCRLCGGVFLDANELSQAKEIARRVRRDESARAANALLGNEGVQTKMQEMFGKRTSLFVKQRKEWLEIITNWETRNKYDLLSPQGEVLGHVAEHATGLGAFLARWLLKTHRPFEAHVWNHERHLLLVFRRPFFWFFSDIHVETPTGQTLGSVHRRFALLATHYDLKDQHGRTFGHLHQRFWGIWRFKVLDARGQAAGEITKKWRGLGLELFSSADTFHVNFGTGQWSLGQQATILAAAVTVDLDNFETQAKGSNSLLGDGLRVLLD